MTNKTYQGSALVQCEGKHKFVTMELAESTFKKKRDNSFMAYRCPHCGFFHVGHRDVSHKFQRVKKIQEE